MLKAKTSLSPNFLNELLLNVTILLLMRMKHAFLVMTYMLIRQIERDWSYGLNAEDGPMMLVRTLRIKMTL